MKMHPICATFCLLLYPGCCTAFFCPTNFHQIQWGNTPEQVEAQCGTPAQQDTKKVPIDSPQEWTYFLQQTVSSDSTSQMQGTLKTTIAFDSQGNAVNISVNGIAVGSTTICGGTTVQLGDKKDAIKAACGEPSMMNTSNISDNNQPPPTKTVTKFVYQSNPPTVFIFENGKLTAKQ